MRSWRVWLALAVCLCGIAGAADFKVGPDTPLDSLAMAAGANNYLAVWRDLRAGAAAPRMYALTVSTTGVVSAEFPVSDAAGLPLEMPVQHATVAFDGVNFLAVWADNRGSGASIRGARITPAGAIAGGADFLIAPITRTDNLAPQVVFTGGDYVVGWQDNPLTGAGTQIYFARVSTAGVPGTASALPVAAGESPAQFLEYLVTGFLSETLLVFQDAGGSAAVTRATRVAADNTVIAPQEGTLLFKRGIGTDGFGVPIAAAFDGTQYQILSSLSAQIDSSVFRTSFVPGSPVMRSSAPFAEVGQGTTGLAEDDFPRAAYNGSNEFLFVRNSKVSETAYHLLTKRVTTAGTDRDPNLPLIDGAARGVLNGAIAAAIGTQYLVLWMDGRRPDYQPSRQTNIYGLFIDGTQAGDESQPYLKAQAHARPTIGNSPMTVGFGTYGSTGIIDLQQWNFGDGATDTLGYTSHIYKTGGIFTAVLSLYRAGFAVRDFVQILVDTDALGGGGGPPESVGGALGPVSAGVNTDVVVASVSIGLNFAKPASDSARFFCRFDPSLLPVSTLKRQGTLVLAGKTYTFTLDVNGLYYSPVSLTPIVHAQLNRYTGALLVTTYNDDLQASLAALGAANETLVKPGKDVVVPFTITFGDIALDSTVTANYTAKAGKVGRASFILGLVGQQAAGYLHIGTAKAVESGNPPVHAFGVVGLMSAGGGLKITPAETGNWRITLGNYAEDVPVTSLTVSGDYVTYTGAKGKTGVNQFSYNTRTGTFVLYCKALPATGVTLSGMALASSPVGRADMALSFDLDLTGGGKYQASAYVRFGRKKAGSKKWALR